MKRSFFRKLLSWRKTDQLDGGKVANKLAGNQPTIYTKTTTKITTNNPVVSSVGQKSATDEWELDSFCNSYQSLYGLPYALTKANRNQIEKLRIRLGDLLTRQRWQKALVNYFASPRAKHTLTDLCANFDTFQLSALDKFNKPTKSNVAAFKPKVPVTQGDEDLLAAVKHNIALQSGAKSNVKRPA